MAVKPRIEVEGSKELRRALKAASDGTLDLKSAHRAAAEVVAKQAAIEVPVRSGRLRASIRPLASKTLGQVAAGRKAVPYAGPIHFGWPSRPNRARGWRGGPIRPQPFLYDAADKKVGEVLSAYEKYTAKTIKEAGL